MCLSGQKLLYTIFVMKTQEKEKQKKLKNQQIEGKLSRILSTLTEQYASKKEYIEWLNEVGISAQGFWPDLENMILNFR